MNNLYFLKFLTLFIRNVKQTENLSDLIVNIFIHLFHIVNFILLMYMTDLRLSMSRHSIKNICVFIFVKYFSCLRTCPCQFLRKSPISDFDWNVEIKHFSLFNNVPTRQITFLNTFLNFPLDRKNIYIRFQCIRCSTVSRVFQTTKVHNSMLSKNELLYFFYELLYYHILDVLTPIWCLTAICWKPDGFMNIYNLYIMIGNYWKEIVFNII